MDLWTAPIVVVESMPSLDSLGAKSQLSVLTPIVHLLMGIRLLKDSGECFEHNEAPIGAWTAFCS